MYVGLLGNVPLRKSHHEDVNEPQRGSSGAERPAQLLLPTEMIVLGLRILQRSTRLVLIGSLYDQLHTIGPSTLPGLGSTP